MAGKKSSKPQRYVENEDHVPNPTHQTGVVDTTGTAGPAAADPNAVSPVFAQARADALGAAVEAIEDPNVDETTVVSGLPEEDLTRDEAVENLKESAEEAKNDPQLTEGLTPGAQEAAEEQDQSAPGRKSRSDAKSAPARSQKDSGNK